MAVAPNNAPAYSQLHPSCPTIVDVEFLLFAQPTTSSLFLEDSEKLQDKLIRDYGLHER